jgi:hypothetical protein
MFGSPQRDGWRRFFASFQLKDHSYDAAAVGALFCSFDLYTSLIAGLR